MIVDIKATSEDDKQLNLEIQGKKTKRLGEKKIVYWGKLFCEQQKYVENCELFESLGKFIS